MSRPVIPLAVIASLFLTTPRINSRSNFLELRTSVQWRVNGLGSIIEPRYFFLFEGVRIKIFDCIFGFSNLEAPDLDLQLKIVFGRALNRVKLSMASHFNIFKFISSITPSESPSWAILGSPHQDLPFEALKRSIWSQLNSKIPNILRFKIDSEGKKIIFFHLRLADGVDGIFHAGLTMKSNQFVCKGTGESRKSNSVLPYLPSFY